MYLGDLDAGEIIDFKFCTVGSTGAPTTLSGTPAVLAYKNNSTTESAATGITLTVDFDARTGLNHVRIDTSQDGTFYANGNEFQIVITAGTVGGTSVVGYVIAHFSLRNRDVTLRGITHTSAVIPTVTAVTNNVGVGSIASGAVTAAAIAADAITAAKVADGTIDAATFAAGAINATAIATGAVDADALALDAVTEIRSLASGTSDSGSTTTMVDAARTEADTDYWKGCFILFTSGNIAGQCRLITAFDPATDTITFAPATTQAVATQTYEIIPAARVDIHFWLGTLVNALLSGRQDVSVGAYQSGQGPLQPTVAGRTLDVTATGEAGIDWANIGAPTTVQGLSGTTIKTATDVETDTQDIQARLPDALVSGRVKAHVETVAANAISDAAVAADMDSYAAKMWMIKDSTTKDEYGVTFYKNGHPLESGITSPLIDYVKKLSDGSILVNDAALTDQSNGDYYYGESTNKLAAGNAYMMRVTATIDGSSRVFKQQIGRDSA